MSRTDEVDIYICDACHEEFLSETPLPFGPHYCDDCKDAPKDDKPFFEEASVLPSSEELPEVPEEENVAELYEIEVTAVKLNIRLGPAKSHPVVRCVLRGERFPVYRELSGWGKISAVSSHWVDLDYAKKV